MAFQIIGVNINVYVNGISVSVRMRHGSRVYDSKTTTDKVPFSSFDDKPV